MLIIRNGQMEIFQQQAEQEFVVSIAGQLRTDCAAALQDVTEEELNKRVVSGIGRAKKYGMTWKNNLTAFVTLMFEIAPDFDMYPVFQKYLTDENVSPDDRMGLLLKETSEDDWQKALKAPAQMVWPEDML